MVKQNIPIIGAGLAELSAARTLAANTAIAFEKMTDDDIIDSVLFMLKSMS